MRLAITISLISLTSAIGCTDDMPADDGESYNCVAETRDEEFVVGLEKIGADSALDFKLMSATPAPPARGDNVWTLQVNAMAGGTVGSPVAGGTLNVTPFMPDHQHGTPLKVVIADMGGGLYELSPVNMWMPGLWETTIQVQSASGSDQAVYRFCIPN
jgi:hypothetical protein